VEVAHKKNDYGSVSFENDIEPGSAHAVRNFVFDSGYKKASVQKRGDYFLVRLDDAKPWSGELTKLAAKIQLMTHGCMRDATADEILHEVEQKGRFNFYHQPFEKLGMNLRFAQFPEFENASNTEFNVLMEPQTHEIMDADYDEPEIPEHRIGDAYREETGETVDVINPTQLYQLSQERGVGNLFEHGVVGALVDTYDSMAMVDKYLPAMEQALDHIGRILFLYYWKPEDFAQAYGSDDQSQLENKLLSNFKSFGDLVLELLQKSKATQEGTVSLI
jgi:hypothetical protein